MKTSSTFALRVAASLEAVGAQSKLLWYRAGGEVSDRQWRDIVSVLRINGSNMDTSYLASWSSRLGITDLLERAKQRAAGH